MAFIKRSTANLELVGQESPNWVKENDEAEKTKVVEEKEDTKEDK